MKKNCNFIYFWGNLGGGIKMKRGIFTGEGMIGAVGIKDVKLFTFYARYGDIFAAGCVILAVSCWLLAVRKIKKREE